jgi:hypothetical protein
MSETRVVKDLSIGDRIQVKGFDDPLVVRSAKKVQKGTDAGKLDMKLAGPDGNIETVRFDPEEAVTVVMFAAATTWPARSRISWTRTGWSRPPAARSWPTAATETPC